MRINALRSGLIQDSCERFRAFNPGHRPVPMQEIRSAFRRNIERRRTGEIIPAW